MEQKMVSGPIFFMQNKKGGQATQIKSWIDRLLVSED
ncbi:hypothetical protein LBA1908 [Lactobacillus acidophilus NCFM]|uniref:Uncharacterized protein n=1 Tax=Lactobacillus acidophilus (strain ATCC 700396 / NCK56 / N2 / NCFM) TaxID=272621 RepID=Q5FHW8_LACAC|nr:hypothetical protein LBA1908 [Lactobacillus acidophilus NCFM]